MDRDHDAILEFDNSGRGPLRVPGFGGIHLNYRLPVDARYVHGVDEWYQTPLVTAQEQAMVAVMDWLTDMPGWSEDVFDDEAVEQWRAELERDRERERESGGHFIANPRLMRSDATWTWCVQELRDKAISYKKHGHVRVLDTGSCACKADSAELQFIGAALRRAAVPLVEGYHNRQAQRARLRKRGVQGEPGARAWLDWNDDDTEPDEVFNTNLEPVANSGEFDVELWSKDMNDNEDSDAGDPARPNTQAFGDDDHGPELPAIARSRDTDSIEKESDGEEELADDEEEALAARSLFLEQLLADNIEYENDSGEEEPTDETWTWARKKRGGSLDAFLETMGDGAHRISVLLDQQLFPLVYGRTLVLQEGGAVTLDNLFPSYEEAQVAPKKPGYRRLNEGLWNRQCQSLPCEVAFVDGGDSTDKSIDVKITSYINGLHPDHHTELYRAIEQALGHAIRPWNDCLVRGRRPRLELGGEYDQLGNVPARIITYGVEWDNELPKWAAAFRVPTASRKNDYHREKARVRSMPAGSRAEKRARKSARSELRSMFADVIGKEHWTLPANDSELWQRAKEYLSRQIPGQKSDDRRVGLEEEDDIVGKEDTWNRLYEKASKLVCHRHPEPGTAFSYDEWKYGRHESRAIVARKIHHPRSQEARRKRAERRQKRRYRQRVTSSSEPPPFLAPLPYAETLQDRFRDQGLQVLVDISSIDLTPESPAYAKGAAAREACFAAYKAKKFAIAMERNTSVNIGDMPVDNDGWQRHGFLNEHVVAVAMVAFDVDNVTEPRLEFRQRREMGYNDLYRTHEYYRAAANEATGNPYYSVEVDGPPHWIGKENESGAVEELVGFPPEEYLHPYNEFQRVGSVALSPPGRLVAFPSVMEHRIRPFRLVDETQPGRLRWLTLSLVDPHYRVCSTRNVPPQQHAWWAAAVEGELQAAAGSNNLSREILDEIFKGIDDWPMSVDEAESYRGRVIVSD